MCSKKHFLEFIKDNNNKEFYENVSVDMINIPGVFSTAAKQRKNGYLLHMINKVVELDYLIKIAMEPNLSTFVQELLCKRINIMETKMKAGYNRLHIAVMDDEADLVDYLLEKRSKEYNVASAPVGTPLHLAMMLCNFGCVQKFIMHQVDVDIINKHNETPLQMAILHKLPVECFELFGLSKNIGDQKYDGLNLLQLAILNNCYEMIPSILEEGLDICFEIEAEDEFSMIRKISQHCSVIPILPLSKTENSVTLCLKMFPEIFSSLLYKLDNDNISMTDGAGNGLLHLAASLQDTDLCSVLISKGLDINLLNNDGNNAFHEMLIMRMRVPYSVKKPVAVGTFLLDNGIDIDMVGSDGRNALYRSSEVNHEKFFIKVFELVTSIDLTNQEFEAIVKRRWFVAVDIILSCLSSETKQDLISKFVVDIYYDLRGDAELLELLKQCSESVINEVIDKILNRAALQNKTNIFQEFLQLNGKGSGFLDNGETLLTNLIREEKSLYVTILIDSNQKHFSLNIPNKSGEYPLHIAIKKKNKLLIEDFVLEMIDINYEDKFGNTFLGVLFKNFIQEDDTIFVKKIAKMIISKGGNPNHKNLSHIQDIDQCIHSNVKEYILEYAKIHLKKNSYNKECSICLDASIDCSLDCGHVCCSECASKLSICHICRKPSNPFKKIFL